MISIALDFKSLTERQVGIDIYQSIFIEFPIINKVLNDVLMLPIYCLKDHSTVPLYCSKNLSTFITKLRDAALLDRDFCTVDNLLNIDLFYNFLQSVIRKLCFLFYIVL